MSLTNTKRQSDCVISGLVSVQYFVGYLTFWELNLDGSILIHIAGLERAFEIFKSLSIKIEDTLEVHYAWYMIGRYYQMGFTFKRNMDMALEWYGKSADKGNDCANCTLGDHYLSLKNTRRLFWHMKKRLNVIILCHI